MSGYSPYEQQPSSGDVYHRQVSNGQQQQQMGGGAGKIFVGGLSPSVTSLSPSSGTDGALLTVSGSGFGITKSSLL